MSNNPYADVIEIITEITDDQWKGIVVEAAKSHPSVVLKACRKIGIHIGKPLHEHAHKDWFAGVIEFCVSERKINAIKYLRESTGLGLKEAKHIVEDIQEKCGDYIEAIKLQKSST